MDKKLYDELVNRNIITDTFLTLEKINENGIKLEDIITQPEMYKIFSKYATSEEVEEIVNPKEDETMVVPVKDNEVTTTEPENNEPTPDVEPKKDVEVEPTKEEEGIVVDDNISPEPIPEAPKTKSKKSKEVVSE